MKKYKLRPYDVEAELVTKDNIQKLCDLCSGTLTGDNSILLPNGDVAYVGKSWIVKKYNKYSVTPDVFFNKTFIEK